MSPNWTRAVNDCWPRDRLGEGGEGRGGEPGGAAGVHILQRKGGEGLEEQVEEKQGEEEQGEEEQGEEEQGEEDGELDQVQNLVFDGCLGLCMFGSNSISISWRLIGYIRAVHRSLFFNFI